MSDNMIIEAIELINDNFTSNEIDFCGKISEETIKSAEEILDIGFPNSYKTFLRELGCGDVRGSEIFGLIKDENFLLELVPLVGIPNVVWVNLQWRRDFFLPSNIILIYGIGDGSHYALDLSQMDDQGECPVVYWPLDGYEATPKLEIVAKDFGEFFLNLIQDKIADKRKSTEA